jgi:steroid 5-alpha reductase family enzyme
VRLNVSFIQLTITALVVCAALGLIMTLAWLVEQKSGNAGWVDVSWSFGVGAVAFVAALLPLHHQWPQWRQLSVALLAASWCLRLGLHIARRTRAAKDDPRYRDLIVQWGADAPRCMFWFLQSQAAVGALLALSIALAAHNPNPVVRMQDLIGFALLVLAVVGEAIADRQLTVFTSNPSNRGTVCDVGLWNWSRHPNYFFEWLGWVAYPIVAIDFAGHNSYGWLAMAAPVSMYWVLVHVSGIPPLEKHMVQSRGDAFRTYQRRTRVFFPFPTSH